MNTAAMPRFYGRRKGRPLSETRQDLLDTLLPQLEIICADAKSLDGKTDEVWLEIGFGAGEHLATQALRHKDIQFIGCEAYLNGITSLLAHIHKNNITNIRIYPDDVRPFLQALPNTSLSKIFVLFPDPWPKKRHHKRRIICPEQLQELNRILKPKGSIVIASDDEGYVEHILEVIQDTKRFSLESHTNNPPAGWVATRYEKRAYRLGHRCHYMVFKKPD